jgi:shikimate kinase
VRAGAESLSTFVAEIIGPAGAGKTSLSQLLRRGQDVRTGLSLWRLPPTRLAISAFSSLPSLVALCVQRKRFNWEDVKLVIQHNALLRLLTTESTKGYQTLLLDEGTVFALAKLRAFGIQTLTVDDDHWMHSLFDKVASRLNAVIWLDAPDGVLARRIRERDKPHRMKTRSDAEIENHLLHYRISFERVVAELRKRNGLKVFRYRTDEVSLEEIAAKVLLEARAQV